MTHEQRARMDRLSEALRGRSARDIAKIESVFAGALSAYVDDATWDRALRIALTKIG